MIKDVHQGLGPIGRETAKLILNDSNFKIVGAIDPKYNALVLKGLINIITMDEVIYPKYHSLFKDR